MSCKPDVETTSIMYELYQQGNTCDQVALAFDVSRQSVYERFKRRGLELRPSSRDKALPAIEWNGARWAPEKDGYFRKTTGGGSRELLHRAIWSKANGEIPPGHEVLFADGDRMNTDLENLVCLPREECQAFRSARRFKPKPCLACGRPMGRRFTEKTREGPAAYARRKTCDTKCSGDWKRGKRLGTKMAGNEDLAVMPRRLRTRVANELDQAAARELEKVDARRKVKELAE